MPKAMDHLTARESVWVHRIRQRIALERIVLSVGNARERQRAKRFLDAMEEANPELFDGIDEDTFQLLEDLTEPAPELFDSSEYCPAKGRKTALKLPRDILWEERVVRRATREFWDLFHPCDIRFTNAMKGLQYLQTLHPDLFARAREQAFTRREQILTRTLTCPCGCLTSQNRKPAAAFGNIGSGRMEKVAERIRTAKATGEEGVGRNPAEGRFFLERIGEIAPEMLHFDDGLSDCQPSIFSEELE
ncbi:MAG: hypothetical protein P8Y91_03585 [Desulfuromonadales bacterium]|jgi:hypothetical protein